MNRKRWWIFTAVLFLAAVVWAAEGETRPNFFSAWNQSKVWVAAGLALLGTVLLLTRRTSRLLRMAVMVVAFLIFGLGSLLPLGNFAAGLGMHPSPMCIIEKPFLFLNAGRAVPIFFISLFTFVGLLTIFSNKSFCGWTCPIGALQELFYKIPLPEKLKRKIPFKISNSIRVGILAIFIALVFAAGFSLYQYANAFHVLHWTWSWELIIPIIIAFVGGIFIYRPFCYLVCPLGLTTWLLEHVAIFKVRVDKKLCTDCKTCVQESPCPTMPAILANKRSRPDCHACGVCIEACPEKALKFRV